jgi:ATP-dependent Clp protease ATP-binding subunit ClpA
VERQLENPLAMRIVTGACPDGSRVRVQVREGQIAFAIGG